MSIVDYLEFETGDHTIVVGEVLDFGVGSDLKSRFIFSG